MSQRTKEAIVELVSTLIWTWLIMWVWNPFHLQGGQQWFIAYLLYLFFHNNANSYRSQRESR